MPAQVNTQFERSFATLAYAFVQEKAQKLMPYMIGFQVIKKDADETRAAGAFGFKLGEQWLYAPMFFLNGDLKGYELLYVKTPDLFVPLQENWVNFMISHDPRILGTGERRNPSQLGILPPDLRTYFRSPLQPGSKAAGFDVNWEPGTEGWRVGTAVKGAGFASEEFDIEPLMSAFRRLPDDSETAESIDLRACVKDAELFNMLGAMIRARPSLGDAVSRFYGGDELVKAACGEQAAKQASPVTDAELAQAGISRQMFNYYVRDIAARGVVSDQTDVGRRVVNMLGAHGVDTPSAVRANLPELTLVRDAVRHDVGSPDRDVELLDGERERDDLTDKEAEALMTDGYAIRDLRTSASVAFEESMLKEHVFSPAETGMYSVLGADGEWHRAFVCVNPRVPGRTGRMAGHSLVAVGDRVAVVRSGRVLAAMRLDADKVAGTVELSDVPANAEETYAENSLRAFYMVSPDGSDATCVMYPCERNDNGMFVNPALPCHGCPPAGTGAAFELADDWLVRKDGSRAKAIFRGPRLQTAYGALVVPDGWRAVRVKPYPEFDLGGMDQAEETLLKRADLLPVTISRDGLGFVVESSEGAVRHAGEKAAVWSLVSVLGLTKDAAVASVRTAASNGIVRVLVKRARSYAPPMSELDDATLYDETYGYPISEHRSMAAKVDGLKEDYATPETYDMRLRSDKRTLSAAEQAAAAGEKEVMDLAVLSAMVESVDIARLVDKYLKNLVRGLDRVGRLLFLYYWHYDKFSDRYGRDEMEELEGALQNTFKSVGDTVLFLKKKTIEPDRILRGSDVSLDSVSGAGGEE